MYPRCATENVNLLFIQVIPLRKELKKRGIQFNTGTLKASLMQLLLKDIQEKAKAGAKAKPIDVSGGNTASDQVTGLDRSVIEITIGDIERLQEGKWLNDTLIRVFLRWAAC